MITAKRIEVSKAVDLAAGSGGSGVSISMLRNVGGSTLYVGDPESPIELEPTGGGSSSQSLPGIVLGSQDHLHVWCAAGASTLVDLVIGWA